VAYLQQGGIDDIERFLFFLPLVAKAASSEPTPTPTSSPRPSDTTPVSHSDTGNIVITSIFYDGVHGPAEPDEIVLIFDF